MLYFDHSATTPMHPKVLQAMSEVQETHYGNPSSIHSQGRKARALIENARRQAAVAIHANPGEIIFTGGGTEANNLVLWNLIYSQNNHVVTSAIEHPAILKVLNQLKPFGISHTIVPVDTYGRVNPLDIESSLIEKTGLVSIMLANNEMGTIQPLKEIGEICKDRELLFHSDAVQTLGKIQVNPEEIGVDMMSFSAHKFYGPKGVGFLYTKKGLKLKPLIMGGGQEHGLRAGTENVPGLVGLGLAAELAYSNLEKTTAHLKTLESRLKDGLKSFQKIINYNGHRDLHLPGLVSLSISGITSDILMAELDREGIAVSSGSACSAGTVNPSPVLEAMGIPEQQNISTLRISFGIVNSEEDVKTLSNVLGQIISRRLR